MAKLRELNSLNGVLLKYLYYAYSSIVPKNKPGQQWSCYFHMPTISIHKHSLALLWLIASFVIYLYAGTISAAELSIQLSDSKGHSAEYAVVSLHPANGSSLQASVGTTASMNQVERQYQPFVLPIQAGTQVNFPNRDDIKHHVYSFSATKRFELKLYSGENASPVTFNKVGTIPLGCNIHDWMLGFIYVTDTPYFARTDVDGSAVIENIPDGDYMLKIWHPGISNNDEQKAHPITVKKGESQTLNFTLSLKQVKQQPVPEDSDEYVY